MFLITLLYYNKFQIRCKFTTKIWNVQINCQNYELCLHKWAQLDAYAQAA